MAADAVLLICRRKRDQPFPLAGAVVGNCMECGGEVYVSPTGRAPAQARARAEGVEVIILCSGCGELALRMEAEAGRGVELNPLTPDQLRASFERRTRGNR